MALAAGLAAAIGTVRARSARRGQRPSERQATHEHETYHCRCGTGYRVSGTDRHRVYWLKDAATSDPVLGTECVDCHAPLPAGHALATS